MLGSRQVFVEMPHWQADDSGLQGLLKHEGNETYKALFQRWQQNAPIFSIVGHQMLGYDDVLFMFIY
jgi:hypothetical protein